MHQQIYTELRNKVNTMITKSKKNHYQEEIEASSDSQGAFFKCVDHLLNKHQPTPLPQHESTKELCIRMASFFSEKTLTIHEGLESIRKDSDLLDQDAGCKQPSNYLI